MYCTHCGSPLNENSKYCTKCGAFNTNSGETAPKVTAESVACEGPAIAADRPMVPKQPKPQPAPQKTIITESDLPEKYSPLRPWTYFWLNVLFCVPIVGFIFLIIFSINDSNINRRNFARSIWCPYIILAIILAVILLISLIGGIAIDEIFDLKI